MQKIKENEEEANDDEENDKHEEGQEKHDDTPVLSQAEIVLNSIIEAY